MTNNIEKIRKELNMTQEELAAKSEVSRITIANIENDKVDSIKTSTMEKISKALGKPVEAVFIFPQLVK